MKFLSLLRHFPFVFYYGPKFHLSVISCFLSDFHHLTVSDSFLYYDVELLFTQVRYCLKPVGDIVVLYPGYRILHHILTLFPNLSHVIPSLQSHAFIFPNYLPPFLPNIRHADSVARYFLAGLPSHTSASDVSIFHHLVSASLTNPSSIPHSTFSIHLPISRQLRTV